MCLPACVLQDVSDIFHSYADRPIVAKNSAPHSGAVAWVRGLMERIEVCVRVRVYECARVLLGVEACHVHLASHPCLHVATPQRALRRTPYVCCESIQAGAHLP